MEDWEFDFEWLRVRHYVKDSMGFSELPDLNSILLMIGVQELGRFKESWTKEEKQDLMHIAVCHLMSYDGYYEFHGRDADGWPHYKLAKQIRVKGVKPQEKLLKEKAIYYFKELDQQHNDFSDEQE